MHMHFSTINLHQAHTLLHSPAHVNPNRFLDQETIQPGTGKYILVVPKLAIPLVPRLFCTCILTTMGVIVSFCSLEWICSSGQITSTNNSFPKKRKNGKRKKQWQVCVETAKACGCFLRQKNVICWSFAMYFSFGERKCPATYSRAKVTVAPMDEKD